MRAQRSAAIGTRSLEPGGAVVARQRGAAVLMALFVATLATIIVTTLFWNQFVLLRTIENQQIVSQSRLLLRGALDWARAILREDAARSATDSEDEPWAFGLPETRLDQLGETSSLAAQASLSGEIEDAQGRFNLRNLVKADGTVNEGEQEALRRLMRLLSIPEAVADLITARMVEAFAAPAIVGGTGTGTGTGTGAGTGTRAGAGTARGQGTLRPAGTGTGTGTGSAAASGEEEIRPLPLVLPQDLAGIDGIDPAAAQMLSQFVVVLDEVTPVNFNTAEAEVIAMRIEGMTLPEARSLKVKPPKPPAPRTGKPPFVNVSDIQNRILGREFKATDVAVSSRYFFVRGQVRLERAVTRMEALVKRSQPGGPPGPIVVLWQREL